MKNKNREGEIYKERYSVVISIYKKCLYSSLNGQTFVRALEELDEGNETV